jgi:hypothetical protein
MRRTGCHDTLSGAGLTPSFLLKGGRRQEDARPGPSGDSAARQKEQEGVFCRRCLHLVTRPEYRIKVNDRHRHTFANPQGIVYTILCFEQADGCVSAGLPPSSDFTWFPGFAWRVGVCRFCRSHLGWQFVTDGSRRFFGLIEDRLVVGGKGEG